MDDPPRRGDSSRPGPSKPSRMHCPRGRAFGAARVVELKARAQASSVAISVPFPASRLRCGRGRFRHHRNPAPWSAARVPIETREALKVHAKTCPLSRSYREWATVASPAQDRDSTGRRFAGGKSGALPRPSRRWTRHTSAIGRRLPLGAQRTRGDRRAEILWSGPESQPPTLPSPLFSTIAAGRPADLASDRSDNSSPASPCQAAGDCGETPGAMVAGQGNPAIGARPDTGEPTSSFCGRQTPAGDVDGAIELR